MTAVKDVEATAGGEEAAAAAAAEFEEDVDNPDGEEEEQEDKPTATGSPFGKLASHGMMAAPTRESRGGVGMLAAATMEACGK